MFSARRYLRFKCAGFRLEIPPKSSFQQHSNAYKTSIMQKNYKKYHLRKRSFGSVFSRANYGHEFSSEETHMYDKETSTQRHAETTPSTLALESEQSGSPSTSRSDFSDSSRSQDGASLSKRRRLSQQKTSSSTDITTARQNGDHTRREFAITSETSNPSSISDQSPRTIPMHIRLSDKQTVSMLSTLREHISVKTGQNLSYAEVVSFLAERWAGGKRALKSVVEGWNNTKIEHPEFNLGKRELIAPVQSSHQTPRIRLPLTGSPTPPILLSARELQTQNSSLELHERRLSTPTSQPRASQPRAARSPAAKPRPQRPQAARSPVSQQLASRPRAALSPVPKPRTSRARTIGSPVSQQRVPRPHTTGSQVSQPRTSRPRTARSRPRVADSPVSQPLTSGPRAFRSPVSQRPQTSVQRADSSSVSSQARSSQTRAARSKVSRRLSIGRTVSPPQKRHKKAPRATKIQRKRRRPNVERKSVSREKRCDQCDTIRPLLTNEFEERCYCEISSFSDLLELE
eukprot:251716_1